jgi:integrase/recombinase XerD
VSMRGYLIIRPLWRTGIRVNELLNIRPCDLEQHTNMVRILKAKGNKQRRVPLDPGTLTQLHSYIDATAIPPEASIFSISQQWVRKLLNKYARLKDKNIHPHTFRHSFAINSVRPGVDLRRLQQVMGHTNINTTATICSSMTRTCRTCMRTCLFNVEITAGGGRAEP